MALGFSCSSCGSEMTVQFLKVGETAQCKSCGAKIKVPPNARTVEVPFSEPPVVPVAETPLTSRPCIPQSHESISKTSSSNVEIDFTGRRAWSPVAIFWLGALFSPLPAGILWSLNHERFGNPRKKWIALTNVLVGSAAYFLAATFVEGAPRYLFMIVSIAVARYFMSSQEDQFATFLARGGRKASIVIPLSICLLVSAPMVYFAIVGVDDFGQRYDAAVQVASDGDVTDAIDSLLVLRREYPEEPATFYSLAKIYQFQEKYDSAKIHITRYLALVPSDQEALDLKQELQRTIDSLAIAGPEIRPSSEEQGDGSI